MANNTKQGVVRSAIVAGIAGGAILVSVLGSGAAMGSGAIIVQPTRPNCEPRGDQKAGCVIITTPSTSSTTAVTVTTTAPQETTVPEVTTTMVAETSTTMMGETTTTMPAVQGNAAAARPVRAQANFTG